MASCKCRFRWKRWRRSGYREVLNSAGVQSLIRAKARELQAAREGSEVITIKGKLAHGCLVRPIKVDGKTPDWSRSKKRGKR